MKKHAKILFGILAAVIMLAACGNEPDNGDGDGNGENPPNDGGSGNGSGVVGSGVSAQTDGYFFTYKGYDVYIGSPAPDLLAALGEPQSSSETESCAFYGMDYMYYYAGADFTTFSPAEGAGDFILSVTLIDDSVTTNEGAYIGMTYDEIVAIYGEPAEPDNLKIRYVKAGMSLSFIFQNGIVNDITYYYDAAEQ